MTCCLRRSVPARLEFATQEYLDRFVHHGDGFRTLSYSVRPLLLHERGKNFVKRLFKGCIGLGTPDELQAVQLAQVLVIDHAHDDARGD